jgi:phosphatidylglycerol:prolipoprotein diacylglycerol transferase
VLPVLLDVPQLGIAVHSRGLMIVLAVLFCHTIGTRWMESLEGIDRRTSSRVLIWLLPAAFVGARLHYVLSHWETYADRPFTTLVLWGSGMHAGGAILLVVVALPFLLRRSAIPVGKFADAFVPALGVSIALARIGCFLRGCCAGVAGDWPWCLRFPADSRVAIGLSATLPLHPVQLYFAAAALFIAGGALWSRRHKAYDGQVGLAALLFYSASAAVIELFRADHAGRIYWGQLPQLEWVALGMMASAAAALVWGEIARARHPKVRPAGSAAA